MKYTNEENERVQMLIDEENTRILVEFLAENLSTSCMIYLEELKPIFPYEKRVKTRSHMACCGAIICKDCNRNYKRDQLLTREIMAKCDKWRHGDFPFALGFKKRAIEDKKTWTG